MTREPFLTIVTVTFNAGAFLERTFVSVLAALKHLPENQKIQYLLIDGASKDGTMDIVNRFKDSLSIQTLSEPDKGLYDAMNKGLALALGKYLWFLNAGDEVHDEMVIERLCRAVSTDEDIYYSDALLVAEDGRSLGLRSEITPHSLNRSLSWKDMALGMKICHQAIIVKTKLAPLYDIQNLSADLDWEIEAMKKASGVVQLDFVLCKYLTGGLSTQRHKDSLIDRWRVLKKHFGPFQAGISHIKILFRGVLFLMKNGKYW